MNLLFQREQTPGKLARVSFKLWGKLELNADEEALVRKYKFDEAVLIEAMQPGMIRKAFIIGFIIFCTLFAISAAYLGARVGFFIGLIVGGGWVYWYINEKRETIFVRDLLKGRHFRCESVVELARKEAWLATITSFLRQVMESAKHWGGVEVHAIEPLPTEEARRVIIKGL